MVNPGEDPVSNLRNRTAFLEFWREAEEKSKYFQARTLTGLCPAAACSSLPRLAIQILSKTEEGATREDGRVLGDIIIQSWVLASAYHALRPRTSTSARCSMFTSWSVTACVSSS